MTKLKSTFGEARGFALFRIAAILSFTMNVFLYSKALCLVFFLLSPWIGKSVQAADEGDFYLEAKFGTNFEVTTELVSGVQLGYLVYDSLGLGVSYEQIFTTTQQSEGKAGFAAAPELRWFFEPLEFAGSMGILSRSLGSAIYVAGTGTYLFAVTPALAVASDIKLRYVFNEGTHYYFSLGARFLF